MKVDIKKIVTNKYFIAGAISIFALGGLLYADYKKLMNYCISFNKIKVNSIDLNNINVDLFLNFKNQSKLKIDIVRTEANVYLNEVFFTKIGNTLPQIIQPETMSVIGFNVALNPSKAKDLIASNLTNILLYREKIILKVDMKLKVKFYFVELNIPYVYESSLKDMMTKDNSADDTQKKQGKCR